jgi:hypothetical protein
MRTNNYLLLGLGFCAVVGLVSLKGLLHEQQKIEAQATVDEGVHVESAPEVDDGAPATSARSVGKVESSLERKLKDLYQDLPRRVASSGSSRELEVEAAHSTPTSLLRAAHQLGDLKQLIFERASLKPQALIFYRLCAKNSDIMTSVRAVCWQDALEIYQELGRDPHADEISSEVRSLSQRL